jgi:dCMP deaminase
MIIGVVGRIAAGKNTVIESLLEMGFEFVKLSKALHDEAKRLGMSGDRGKLQDLGNQLRQKGGAGVLAKMLIPKLDINKNYVIDGIRNHNEVLELKKLKNFVLISVDAPQKIRFERVLKRGKEYDPKTWEEFVAIDERDFCERDKEGRISELGQQVGRCMELADFKLVNDKNFEDFKACVLEITKKIQGKYGR